VRKRVPEGLGETGAQPEARAWGRIGEDITREVRASFGNCYRVIANIVEFTTDVRTHFAEGKWRK
jgi:hypothetical protein